MRNASKLACRLANNTLANIQANLSPFRCIPHYVTQRDVERNNCSLEPVGYRHFSRPYVSTRGCGYARLYCNYVIEFTLLDSVVDMAEAKLLQHNLMNEPSVHRMYDMCSYHVKTILSKFCNAFIEAR